jgi:tetratricopeptide (TPR) repeat protein
MSRPAREVASADEARRRLRRDGRDSALHALVVAALYCGLIVLYWPTLSFAAISLDDYSSLQEFAGQPLTRIWAHDHFGHYRPLKNLLFWSFSRIPTESLVAARLALLGVHLLCVALVQRWCTLVSGSRWIALVAAAIWAVHPSSATVVSWLSAGNLAACLVGVLAYLLLGARATVASASGRRQVLLSLLALSSALLSHELAFVAPILLLVQRHASGRTDSARALVSSSLALVLLFAALRWSADGQAPTYRFASEPYWTVLLSAARYTFVNGSLWLWPFERFGVLLRDRPSEHLLTGALCWLALLVVVIAVWRRREREPMLLLGAAWSFAFIAPVANFAPFGNTPVAVHYLYLPGVGLALAFAALAARLVGALHQSIPIRIVGTVLLVALLSALSVESRKVLAAWSDEEQLYRATHEHYPDNVEVMANLSSVYLRRGDHERAATMLERASKVAPHDSIIFANRVELLLQMERPQVALDLLESRPAAERDVTSLQQKGRALRQLRRNREAAAAFERAFVLADRATQAEERYRAGFDAIIELLQSDQGRKARDVLEQLLREHPGRQELQLAKKLLASEAE